MRTSKRFSVPWWVVSLNLAVGSFSFCFPANTFRLPYVGLRSLVRKVAIDYHLDPIAILHNGFYVICILRNGDPQESAGRLAGESNELVLEHIHYLNTALTKRLQSVSALQLP